MMNIKKLLIEETEKKDILRQYGLITEEVTEPTKTMDVNVKINFRGGYYSEEYANFKVNLDPQLSKVSQFLKSGQGKAYLVTVEISSSESKLPNVDNENGGVEVKPKFLAQERIKTIQEYITDKLTSFVTQKLLLSVPKFKAKSEITGPEWINNKLGFCPKKLIPANDSQGFICKEKTFNPGVDAQGKQITNWYNGKNTIYSELYKQYLDSQNITVRLKLEELTDMKKCLDGMVIEVNYTNLSEGHKCNNSTYHIYLTGGGKQPTADDMLFRDGDGKNYASLDNNGSKFDNNPGTCKGNATTDQSCRRYNKFTVTPEMANKVLTQSVSTQSSDGKPFFTIWAQCSNYNGQHDRWGTGCHASNNDPTSGVGDVVITNGLKQKTVFTVKTPVTRSQIKGLKNINACGA
jgi:hypothetical protein